MLISTVIYAILPQKAESVFLVSGSLSIQEEKALKKEGEYSPS